MGIELALGAASLAIGLISAVSASSDRAKAASIQTTANNVAIAQQTNNSNYDMRSRIREERVRQAQIEQGSQNGGTAGSSSESGALSSLDSNFNALTSQEEGQTKANVGINRLNQDAVNADESAKDTLAWNDVFQSGIKTTQNIFHV